MVEPVLQARGVRNHGSSDRHEYAVALLAMAYGVACGVQRHAHTLGSAAPGLDYEMALRAGTGVEGHRWQRKRAVAVALLRHQHRRQESRYQVRGILRHRAFHDSRTPPITCAASGLTRGAEH
jgi:hypothetical protein